MAVDAQFLSEKMGFSQDNHNLLMTPNLSPLPPQSFDFGNNQFFSETQQQLQQQRFVQGMGMGMGMGMGQEMVSYPCSSSSYTANFNSGNEISLINSLAFSQSFAALLDKHLREVDLYLQFQGEKLKEALHQQKKQQMALLLNNYESRTMALIREKEQDLEKLRLKTTMLEQYLKKAEEETELWQRVAKEKEEMVIQLNNMLLLLRQNLCNLVPQHNDNDNDNDNDDDAESVCDCGNAGEEQRGSHEEKQKSECKWCKCGDLCVVFLPCKHLCCCKECEPVLELCPVCHSVKQGSMEVFLS